MPEIAHASLVPETTMAQRITRAKKKCDDEPAPTRVPEAADLPARLGGVPTVLFLVFDENTSPPATATRFEPNSPARQSD
ncbi:MAG TPA: hypothetical protein VJT31_34430 [Rugosimonospora sp.]|nr:hypothetical protein [Rugosimonospora sp.]